ncbi:MAG: GNAT family N-acetyltransferase [Pedobacter sp.]|nr:GNAT family N-acetyltransferase [Pedobacter sp.]
MKNNAYILGAYLKDELCGIGSVKFVNDYAEVNRVFVLEQFRGLSVADQLLEALMAHVQSQGIS